MFSPNDFNNLLAQVLGQLGIDPVTVNQAINNGNCGNNNGNKNGNNNGDIIPPITPAKALVIAGLLTGVLEAKSISVDRDQVIGIALEGSLTRPTPMDKLMDQLGTLPFDTVMKGFADKYL